MAATNGCDMQPAQGQNKSSISLQHPLTLALLATHSCLLLLPPVLFSTFVVFLFLLNCNSASSVLQKKYNRFDCKFSLQCETCNPGIHQFTNFTQPSTHPMQGWVQNKVSNAMILKTHVSPPQPIYNTV